MVYGYLYRLHHETVDEKNTFRPNEGEANQLLKYVWRNDSLIMVMPKDEMIGMCRANGNWTSYAEATYKAVKLDNNTAAPSDAATVQDGLMLYMDVEGQSQLYPVKYALDGDDVYLGDLSANIKGLWIKGKKDGTTVTFPPTSYIGIDTTTACYMYASSAVMGKGVDDDRSTNIFDTYRYALINAWDKRPAAPLPPKLTAFQPYDPNPWGGPGGLQFTLSYYSTDFNYLDPSHLYYNLYIDDELVTFSPEDYQNLKTEMTDVPYSFSDQYEFYKYDENHRTIYFYKDVKKKIGMEAVYVDGDLRFGSGITEYYPNGDPTGVDMTEATVKQIKSVDFYDLSGRKLSAPAKGICIRTITYTDGSKASRKIVK